MSCQIRGSINSLHFQWTRSQEPTFLQSIHSFWVWGKMSTREDPISQKIESWSFYPENLQKKTDCFSRTRPAQQVCSVDVGCTPEAQLCSHKPAASLRSHPAVMCVICGTAVYSVFIQVLCVHFHSPSSAYGQHSMDMERDFFLTSPTYLVCFPTALFWNVFLPH